MDCIDLSIKSLDAKCRELANFIVKDFSPEIVIYVAKGGYLIGKSIAEELDVPLIAVGAERKGNSLKEICVPILCMLPRNICNLLRRLEIKSNIHDENIERKVEFLDDIDVYKINNIKKILIVDDSVDTGNSLKTVKKVVQSAFYSSEIRIAALNVMSQSKGNICVDYSIYEDVMLRTPMSKDSREYRNFLEIYKKVR